MTNSTSSTNNKRSKYKRSNENNKRNKRNKNSKRKIEQLQRQRGNTTEVVSVFLGGEVLPPPHAHLQLFFLLLRAFVFARLGFFALV